MDDAELRRLLSLGYSVRYKRDSAGVMRITVIRESGVPRPALFERRRASSSRRALNKVASELR